MQTAWAIFDINDAGGMNKPHSSDTERFEDRRGRTRRSTDGLIPGEVVESLYVLVAVPL
jgi:hypothetical protein